jgi:BirA family transcriptional regulator, biotin operon repressor / biotin---[acetyl-CoA-carboxylase] ligase
VIDLDGVRAGTLLRTTRIGRSLEVRASTGSTNDDAREAADRGVPGGHVVVADAQTGGRGSRGRTWSSPPGVDLYLSIVERIALSPTELPLVTLAVGLGVTDAITELAPARAAVRIKWPNDAWIDGKKASGILVESSSSGARQGPVIIGIGLGVNRTELPAELAGEATSIRLASGKGAPALDRTAALATLLLHVEHAIDALVNGGALRTVARVRERLALMGERVRIDEITGTLVGLTDEGALRVETASGERVIIAGTLRPLA